MKTIKNHFPIFKNNPDLVYLDSSASSQKPQVVIDAVSEFYTNQYANIHRGIYDLSQNATDRYEEVREKVAQFIGARHVSEIVLTSGTTEALNLVAFGWAKKKLQKGDIVVLSEMEHHSNIVPWLVLKKEIGIELVYLLMTKDFKLDYKKIADAPQERIKLISLTHASNVLGTINPLEEIISYFKKINPDMKICIDAAQSVPHMPVNVLNLGCDFLAFSSHKMLGSSGVGVLYAKKELLDEMEPHMFGGNMIRKVTKESVFWADTPDKFEAGTPNIEGVIGLGAAIDYLQEIGLDAIQKHEQELISYSLEMFKNKKNVTLFGPHSEDDRLGVFSFAIGNVHPHDTAEILNRLHIAVRTGHHCAQVLMTVLGVAGTARASLYLYNTKEDIDRLQEGIEEVKKTFKI